MGFTLKNHVILGALARVIMIAYGEWHDKISKVKYTDVDYAVITDGAYYTINGESPFLRHTYRYTPLLALLMRGNFIVNKTFGKIMFSIFDLLTGWLIFKIVKSNCNPRVKTPILCACLWWYNPFSIAICTRGNADSVMTLLTLTTVWCLMKNKVSLAAIFYGFSVHFKIYPVIYAPVIYLCLNQDSNLTSFKDLKVKLTPNITTLKFIFISLVSFVIPTLWSYIYYGNDYLNEALLYHISRKDIRHNFSPYFYLLYLTDINSSPIFNQYFVFIPQLILFALFALKFSVKRDLPFCFFATTFTFVMFNKVCTSQYFLWFLCYLPVLLPKLKMSVFKGIALTLFWVLGQGLWLLFAYYLEFEGVNTYLYIYAASMVFFIINIWVLISLVVAYNPDEKLKYK